MAYPHGRLQLGRCCICGGAQRGLDVEFHLAVHEVPQEFVVGLGLAVPVFADELLHVRVRSGVVVVSILEAGLAFRPGDGGGWKIEDWGSRVKGWELRVEDWGWRVEGRGVEGWGLEFIPQLLGGRAHVVQVLIILLDIA
jgi:hypothetical protein